MPDDNDPTLTLLRRMDEKLDRLLAGRADPRPWPAVLERSAENDGTAGGDGQPSSAQPDPARPDADEAVNAMGVSPDWPFASLQRLADGQGRIEMALARLRFSSIGRAAGGDAASAAVHSEPGSAVAALEREMQDLRADVVFLNEAFAIQHRAMRRDGDRIMALERRVFEGKTL